MAYTYDDFQKALNASGLQGSFSQYDLDLAQRHPDAGLSILSAKQDYQKATTDEARLLANEMANQVRSSYGNYTGGADGSQYYSNGMYANMIDDTLGQIGNYGSFNYDAYSDPYAGMQQQLLDAIVNRPAYDNKYEATQQQLLDAIINRPEFSYAKENDPQWSSYKKSYLREGDRATSDALAKTSAASGGRASSYAVNAATQAGDYYAAKLNDVIPTLYQQAYDRYLKEYQMKQSDLSAVNTQEQYDYAKYLDDYNMNLSGLGAVNNQQNMDYSRYQDQRDFSYQNYLDEYSRMNNYYDLLVGQDATDYSRGQDALNQRLAQEQADRDYRLQMLDAAMRQSDLYGYTPDHYSDILGIPGGTPTADQAYRDWQIQQQALAAAAKSSGGGGGSSGSSGSRGKTYSDDDSSDEIGEWDNIDMASVLSLGYGAISKQALEKLLESGAIIGEEGADNMIRFKRAGDFAGNKIMGWDQRYIKGLI